MLPLGKLRVTSVEGGGAPSKFTPDEQQTVMTLWSIFRSPLIFGGDLPSNDPATTALITNEEVLEVDQRSHGGHQVLDRGNLRVWVADSRDADEKYVALFNLGDTAQDFLVNWVDLGLSANSPEVRDLWTHKSLGALKAIHANLRPHASAFYALKTAGHE
jgi:hypothetical protein